MKLQILSVVVILKKKVSILNSPDSIELLDNNMDKSEGLGLRLLGASVSEVPSLLDPNFAPRFLFYFILFLFYLVAPN